MKTYEKYSRVSDRIDISRGICFSSLIVLILLTLPFCRVRKEPEKVWNLRGKLVGLAKSLVGLPYRYGGKEIDGFDCSGFTFYIYDCFGITLPRTAEGQSELNEKIKLKHAKPADILLFKFGQRWHTAFYIGANCFIHAPTKNDRLRVEPLNETWKQRLKFVIRVIEE
ncbi:MAG: C40 family peptidase [Acidobacteria bacterium]|jgi:hypothetical protein|nr:C40 family peptidase [Acidobacteriota bacterium]